MKSRLRLHILSNKYYYEDGPIALPTNATFSFVSQKVFKEYLLNGNVCEFLVVVGWLKFFIAIIEVILGADTKFNLIHQKECITMNDALRKQATRAPLTFVFLQLFFVLAKFIFSRKIVLL